MNLFKFFRKRILSFKSAGEGLLAIVKQEPNARIHLLATVLVIIAIFIFKLNLTETLFVISAVFFVWVAEIFNTSIEEISDFIYPHSHQKIKLIKDLTAGGVLLSALYAVLVAILIAIARFRG